MSAAKETIADLVRAHLMENRDSLAKQAVAQAIVDLQNSLKWRAEQDVAAQLGEFYKSEIAPAVQVYLEENREEIIAVIVGSVGEQVRTLAQKLSEDMAKRLGDDWNRRAIVKALFGIS